MWLLLVLVLVLSVCLHCRAFQCSTFPYSKQVTEYFVCAGESLVDKYYNDVTNINGLIGCQYPATLPVCDIRENTPSTLCWNWQVLDSPNGMMKVTFPLLPQRCNFTGYDVSLMVHEATHCPADMDDFDKHSKKEITIKDCLNPSCEDQCSQVGTVVFRHVYSACYQLFIVPKRKIQAYQLLQSSPVVIITEYDKTPISTINSPGLHLDWNSPVLSLQAQFGSVNPTSSHITLSYGIKTSNKGHDCRNTGVPLSTCITCLGSPEIQCQSGSSEAVIPTCSYQGDSVVSCKFSGLKPGNYCVRVQFDDDRCLADTVWNDNHNYSTCTWEVFQQFLSESPVLQDPRTNSANPLLLIFFILAVIACTVSGFMVYRNIISNESNHFLPVQKTMQISERPTLLLVYVRDCAPFMEAVMQLRTLIRRGYNIQVLDCWEDFQYNSVAQNPTWWLMSLINNPRVNTVFVTSPASVLQEAGLVRNIPVKYRQPKAFDSVINHAISSLHETCGHDAYSRLFIVRFDTGQEGVVPKVRTYLNPLTTYILPVHLNKLMSTLCNAESTTSDETQMDAASLTATIMEYRQYLSENPTYLDALLKTENGSPLLNIVM